MGKASKWIINFLLGKKEDKKHADRYLPSSGIPPAAPKVRRRWSFGRSSGREISHRSSKSMDSMDTSLLVVPRRAVGPGSRRLLLHQSVALCPYLDVENAAATKIQAVFRAYLARRALWALKSLVKLQALVRGYLVRKQTSATMRCMRSLMSIQVRARVQRVQMAEETESILNRRRSIHRKFPRDNGNIQVQHNMMGNDDHEISRVSKSKSGHFDHSRFERIERGYTTYYSGILTSLNEEQQLEEYYFSSSAQNTPRIQPTSISKPESTTPSFGFEQADCISDFVPHYMANTESSKAKARSHSEPKQRPQKRMLKKSKRGTSIDWSSHLPTSLSKRGTSIDWSSHLPTETRTHNSSSDQEPWFVKLYRSRRMFKDSESDCTSTVTSQSNYTTPLLAYEPHITMY